MSPVQLEALIDFIRAAAWRAAAESAGEVSPPSDRREEAALRSALRQADGRMNQAEFRALLTWRMVSDPWPAQVDVFAIDAMLNREAVARGYADWVEAYHLLGAEIQPNWTTKHRVVEP